MLAGTAFNAALVAIIIVGAVMSASVIPPTSGAERGSPNQPMNTDKASRPNTTEGTAARLLMFTSMKSFTLLLLANSSK